MCATLFEPNLRCSWQTAQALSAAQLKRTWSELQDLGLQDLSQVSTAEEFPHQNKIQATRIKNLSSTTEPNCIQTYIYFIKKHFVMFS